MEFWNFNDFFSINTLDFGVEWSYTLVVGRAGLAEKSENEAYKNNRI